MLAFLRQTAWLTYCFWFKPYTLNRLIKQTAGEVDLDGSLLRKRVWQPLLKNKELLTLFLQLALGSLFVLTIGCVLVEVFNSITLAHPFRWWRVAVGVAVGVSFILFYFAILSWFLGIVWTAWQWWRARQSTAYANRAFARSAIFRDERIRPPLPLFDRLLVTCARANPHKRDEMISQTLASDGQAWAARRALAQLTQEDLFNAASLAQLKTQAIALSELLIANESGKDRLLPPVTAEAFRRLLPIATNLGDVPVQPSPSLARSTLTRLRKELDGVAQAAVYQKQPAIKKIIEQWGRLITRHEEELNTADHEREKLRAFYYAGSGLEAGSPVFRGRSDVFEVIEEVTANLDRPETLVLIGQPRMGKSSTLKQLPDKLPNMLMLYVDCQKEFNTDSTAGYAYAIMHSMATQEAARAQGLRLTPVSQTELQNDPIQKLNHWLEDARESVRRQSSKRRVFLCFDEFEKILIKIDEGKISLEALNHLRGLSQAKGFQVLFSGQYGLDDYARKYAEYFKNARRIKISYLDPLSTRDLILHPEPGDDQMRYADGTAERIMELTHCQPCLVQVVCSQLVTRLNLDNRKQVMLDDVQAVIPDVLESYYFPGVRDSLSEPERDLLRQIARSGNAGNDEALLDRLHRHDFIEPAADGKYRL